MPVKTAKELAEHFSRMSPDDVIVYSYWTELDVEGFDTSLTLPELWNGVCKQASNALESFTGEVNDAIIWAVEEFLAEHEEEEEEKD